MCVSVCMHCCSALCSPSYALCAPQTLKTMHLPSFSLSLSARLFPLSVQPLSPELDWTRVHAGRVNSSLSSRSGFPSLHLHDRAKSAAADAAAAAASLFSRRDARDERCNESERALMKET